MNCPYCNVPMEEGRFEAWQNQGVYWIPKDSDMRRLSLRTVKKAMKEENAIKMGEWSITYATKTPQTAYCCRDCGVIIAKYK